MRERNYGLDLCRAVSMAMIVALHVLGQGGILESYSPKEAGFWLVWFMETCAYCSVDLFALLSGYLSIESQKQYSSYRILELICIVASYCVVLTALFYIFAPRTIADVKTFISALCPPLADRYWYITCFIPLALFQPYINKGLMSLNVAQHRNICIICFIFLSGIPSLCNKDLFRFEYGYSFAWLVVCYIIGAYLKRSKAEVKRRNAVCAFFIFGGFILFLRFAILVLFHRNIEYMLSYTSPLVLLMAVALLLLCSQIYPPVGWVRRTVGILSGFSFDVYILHAHILIYDCLIKDNFVWITHQSLVLVPFLVIGCIAGIYAAGIFTGYIRKWLYRVLHIENLIKNISMRFDTLIYHEHLPS